MLTARCIQRLKKNSEYIEITIWPTATTYPKLRPPRAKPGEIQAVYYAREQSDRVSRLELRLFVVFTPPSEAHLRGEHEYLIFQAIGAVLSKIEANYHKTEKKIF